MAYQRDGRVEIKQHDPDRVVAVVRGSMPYTVELRHAPRPSWSCTCPVGEDGEFCKHCVAAALAVPAPDRAQRQSSRRGDGEQPDLRRYLAELDPDELVELLVEQSEDDWRLRERLTTRAIATGGGTVDMRIWKKRIDAVFGDRRSFVPYAEAGAWAQDIFEVMDALGDVVDAGHATAVIGLAEHAHRRADAAIQYVDDSDGWLTDISGRLGELHLRACDQGRPDPIELAGRLAELELTSELDTFTAPPPPTPRSSAPRASPPPGPSSNRSGGPQRTSRTHTRARRSGRGRRWSASHRPPVMQTS
jgi:hypothetical protein